MVPMFFTSPASRGHNVVRSRCYCGSPRPASTRSTGEPARHESRRRFMAGVVEAVGRAGLHEPVGLLLGKAAPAMVRFLGRARGTWLMHVLLQAKQA